MDVCDLCLIVNLHVKCCDIRIFYTSLPFVCLYVACSFLLLAMIINLLMCADVRTPGSGNDHRDVVA